MNQGIFFRVNGIRVIDVIVTIISAILVARVFKLPLYVTIPGMFLLGIVAHRVFGIHTTVDKYLFD
jgi:hypothetical protein